jgi:hypothetical protein
VTAGRRPSYFAYVGGVKVAATSSKVGARSADFVAGVRPRTIFSRVSLACRAWARLPGGGGVPALGILGTFPMARTGIRRQCGAGDWSTLPLVAGTLTGPRSGLLFRAWRQHVAAEWADEGSDRGRLAAGRTGHGRGGTASHGVNRRCRFLRRGRCRAHAHRHRPRCAHCGREHAFAVLTDEGACGSLLLARWTDHRLGLRLVRLAAEPIEQGIANLLHTLNRGHESADPKGAAVRQGCRTASIVAARPSHKHLDESCGLGATCSLSSAGPVIVALDDRRKMCCAACS